jgi:hypothetical protein
VLIVPYQTSEENYCVFMAFDDEGVDRIRRYDPAAFEPAMRIPQFAHLKLVKVLIGYYTEQDQNVVADLLNKGKLFEALQYLSRGFEVHREDHDHQALSLISNNEVKA